MSPKYITTPIVWIGLSISALVVSQNSYSAPLSQTALSESEKAAAEKAAEAAKDAAETQKAADSKAAEVAKASAEKAAEAAKVAAEAKKVADAKAAEMAKAATEKAAEDEKVASQAKEVAEAKAAEEQKVAEAEKAAKEKAAEVAKAAAEKGAEQKAEAEKAESAEKGKKDGSKPESAARPYDLDIVSPVQLAGSDEASKVFQKEVLPGILKSFNSNDDESSKENEAKDRGTTYLDPSELILGSDREIRAYFVSSKSSKFSNALGFSTTGGSPLSEDAALIFPDASRSNSDERSERDDKASLRAGDFVNLGKFADLTKLDFFLIAEGADEGKDFYSTEKGSNYDGIMHAMVKSVDGSPYLLIGFSDGEKGNKRYNQLIFALDIGMDQLKTFKGLGAPEPSLATGSIIAAIALINRRRRR
jgi:hypothetical protein